MSKKYYFFLMFVQLIGLTVIGLTAHSQTNSYVFAGSDEEICSNNFVTLSDADTSSCSSVIWTTSGDGSFNNIQLLHPEYTPGAGDIANGSVVLTLTGDMTSGVQLSDDCLLTIHPLPVSSFTFSPDNACRSSEVQFNSSSSVGVQSYSWDFGDGQTSTVANPLHIFQNIPFGGGIETRTTVLTVENQYACTHTSDQVVHIKQGPDAQLIDPLTNFNNCSVGGGSFNITVHNNSSTSASNTNYWIDWGDGSAVFNNTTFTSKSHTYNTGIYTITHTVTGPNGCTDTKTYDVLNIANPAVGATNQGNSVGCSPKDIIFEITGEGNHSSTYYVVDYGDGSDEEIFNHPPPAQVTHIYTQSSCGMPDDEYVFSVTAINACSQTTATVDAIKIYMSPEAHFSIDQSQACTGEVFNFTNQSITGYNNSCQPTTLYTWYFGDGQSQSTYSATAVSHSYANAGVYEIALHAGNSCSTDIETHSICVDSIPIASFTCNKDSLCPGEALTISNLTMNNDICSSYQYDWSIIYLGGGCGGSSGSWTYASGSSSSSNEPSFLFNSAGNYTITLTASNSCGSASYNKTVFVKDEAVLNITAIADSYCGSASVNPLATINACGGSMNYFLWQFPGGSPASSGSEIPGTIIYDQAGIYTISLSAGNECGISSTSITFEVQALPIASPDPQEQTICSGNFTNISLTSSLPGQTSFSYFPINDPGIENTSAGSGSLINQQPVNNSDVIASILYKIIPEANGCEGDTSEAMVHVQPIPALENSDLIDSVCSGADYSITFIGNNPAVSFEWTVRSSSPNISDFAPSGSGTSIEENYTNSSTNMGYIIYDIEPITGACYGVTEQLTVYVKPIPQISISNTRTDICSGTETWIEMYSAPTGAIFYVETEAIAGVSGNQGYIGLANVIEQNLINNLNEPKTVTYTIYAIKDGCISETQSTQVIVRPIPEAGVSTTSVSSPQSICSGQQSEEVVFSSDVNGTSYNWQVSNTVSSPVYEQQNGSTAFIPAQQLSVSGSSTGVLTYTIVPSASGCIGSSFDYSFSIEPLPLITNSPSKQEACSGMLFPTVLLSANINNTVIHWEVIDGGSLGVSQMSGIGQLPEETLFNSTNQADSVVYRIHAVRTDGENCLGPDFYYYRIIKSIPDVQASPVTQQICPGTSTSIQLSSTTHPGQASYSWTVAANSLGAYEETDKSIIAQILSNNSNTNQSVIYQVTPSFNGCSGNVLQVPVQVYPLVHLTNNPLEKTICSGEQTQIQLQSNLGAGTTTWSWTGNAPAGGINGISPAGNSSTINDVLTNLTFSTKTASYTITPTANECAGTSSVYQVFVDPVPDIQVQPANSVLCSGESTYIILSSSVSGAAKKWRVEYPASAIQGASGGVGGIIEQSLTNSSLLPQTVTYYCWTEYGGCISEEIAANVIVNPVPNASVSPLNQLLCSGNNMDTAFLSADVAGTNFSWTCTASSSDVNGYSNGNGSFIYGDALENHSDIRQSVFYHITSNYAGCDGNTIIHSVFVDPLPEITNPAADLSQSICSGGQSQLFIPQSNVNAASFSWSIAYAGASISGYQSSGNGSIPPQTLINSGIVADSIVYSIVPEANNCAGEATFLKILIKAVPIASSTPASDQICSGDQTQLTLSSNLTAVCQYSWTTANTSGITNISGGTGNQIQQNPENTTDLVKTFNYIVTPEYQGCVGNTLSIPITVTPLPRITNTNLSKTICSGSFTNILLQSSRENTTYAWTGTQIGGNFIDGISPNGSENPINDQLLNEEQIDGNVVYTVTPISSSCTGNSKDFQVEVAPLPDISVTANITEICNNDFTEIDVTANFGNPQIFWEVSASASVSGYSNGNSIGGTQIHQQLHNTAFVEQDVQYLIYAKEGNCYSDTSIILISIQPEPEAWANPQNPQYICSDGISQEVVFESNVAGLSYVWQGTASVPGILQGYYANQQNTSTIPAHHIQNTGTQQAYVSYVVTPSLGECSGDDFIHKIYVSPVVHLINASMSQNICNGASTEEVVFETDVAANVQWEVSVAPTGLSNYINSGSGNLPSMAVTNTSLEPKTLVYNVTPYNGSAYSCSGPTQEYSILVYPTVTGEATPSSQETCSNDSVFIALSSPISDVDFSWNVSHSSNILNVASGNARFIRQKPVNIGNDIELVSYHISPEKSGCTGEEFSASVYVMPVPLVLNASSDSVCSGETTNISLQSNVEGAVFEWQANPSSGNISGYTPNIQQGSLIQDVLINGSTQMQWVTYTVLATANSCSGPAFEITIYVNPSPEVDFVPEQTILCSGETTDIHLSSSSNNVNFEWTVSSPSGLSGASSGSGLNIQQLLINNNNVSGNIIYHVQALMNGCPGPPEDYTVLVKPRPGISINELGQTICSGSFTTEVELSSNVAGTEFHWSGTASSDELSGYFQNMMSGDNIPPHQIINPTVQQEYVNYTISTISNGCLGDSIIHHIDVVPRPELVLDPMEQEFCSGNTSTQVLLNSTIQGTAFSWTAINPNGFCSGYTPQGNGNIPPMTVVNSNNETDTVIYRIVPRVTMSMSCPGDTAYYLMIVHPAPQISAIPAFQVLCSGDTTNIALQSTVNGTEYYWTVVAPASIEGAENGSGASIVQNLHNLSDSPQTVSYMVYGNVEGCSSSVIEVQVQVNPAVYLDNPPFHKSICSGLSTNVQLSANVNNATFCWSASCSSALVEGFSNDCGSLIDQVLVNHDVVDHTVSYAITPTAYGCSGVVQNYQVTVKPLPDVAFNPLNLSVCSGDITEIQLSSEVAGSVFQWTANYDPGINGDFSSGSEQGALIEDSLINSVLYPANAVYTVLATANGCSGPEFEYPVLVNPRPIGSLGFSDQLICSGNTTVEVNFSANVPGTVYEYSGVPSSTQLSGVLYNQTGNHLPIHILNNTGLTQQYVDYTITPIFNTCSGENMHHLVYVNPLPQITTLPMQQELCSGEQSAQVDLQSNIGEVSYSWTATATSLNISLPTWSGNTNYLPAEIITNNGFETDTVIYEIVASMTNGISCPAPPDYYYTLVHPIPNLQADLAHDSICSNEAVSITLSSLVENTTFYWTVTAPPTISGALADSLQTVIDDVLINSGTDVEEVVYHIRPQSNGCVGPMEHISVFVQPAPIITNTVFSFNQCSGDIFSLQLLANVNADFQWTATASSSCITGHSDGNGSIIQQQLSNSCYETAYVTYHVSPYNNGCSGAAQDFTVYIHALPDVVYNPPTLGICSGDSAIIHLNSNVNNTNFNYLYEPEANISGGNNGSGNAIAQRLENAGQNTAAALYRIVPYTNYCQGDTNDYSVDVYPNPSAGFMHDTVCFGSPTAFADTSVYFVSSPQSRFWTFGDGQTSAAQNPSVILNYEGALSTKLIVTDLNGCRDSVAKNVEVYKLPDVAFSATANQVGIPTQFSDFSLPNASAITDWHWDFGDGTTSNLQNPDHMFLFSGTYNVCLSVTNSNACTDVLCQDVDVFPVPIPQFTFDTACFGLSTHFYDLSSSPSGAIASWQWDFGDGGVSNIQNPEHLYAMADTFNVRLIVTDILGSYDTIEHAVFVHSLPIAAFTSDTVCYETATQLSDLSSTPNGTIQSWNWLFADAQSSVEQNPSIILGYEGCQSNRLIVSDIYGCLDTISQNICVDSLPEALFAHTTVQNALPTVFTDQSQAHASSLISWHWDFGDGTTSTEQNPEHIYENPGTYTVCLEVQNEHNCQSSWCNNNVIVHPLPTPEFTFDTACFGLTTHFYDLSSSPSGAIVSWQWGFGDGGVSNIQNPEHLYAMADTFNVRLIVTDILGSYDTIEHEVFVHSLPIAAFSSDTVCHETATQLNDLSSTPNGTIQSWNWLFVDGQSSVEQNPSIILGYEGCQSNRLIVSDIYGCLDTISQNICVDSLPEALFAHTTVQNALPTVFTDQSQAHASSLISWHWDFGDGTTSTEQNPEHIYENPGTYTVCLEVQNEHNCQSSWCNNNVIVHPLPTPEFTFDTACFGLTTHFYDLSSSPSGAIVSWQWDFGDGGVSNIQNPEHLYAMADTFNVRLIITDILGSYDTIEHAVFVHSLPIAAFTSDTVCYETATQLSDLSSTPNGTIQSWNWLFVDGQSSVEQNPSIILGYEGCQSNRLIVSDIYGCLDTISQNICVDSLPEALFAHTTVQNALPTVFTDQSHAHASSLISWHWDFGDGTTSTEQNPEHIYENPGTYTVCLEVQNEHNCQSSWCNNNVIVHPLPTPEFTFDTACFGLTTHFYDLSSSPSGAIVSWQWDFGDGGVSNIQNPEHLYAMADTFNVRLIVTDILGSYDTIEHAVFVHSLPIAAFTSDTVCYETATQLSDLSSTPNGTIQSWNWLFADAQSSVEQNPSIILGYEGCQSNRLIVSDIYGCLDTISQNICVDSLPEPSFTYVPAPVFEPIYFTNTTIPHGKPVGAWFWDFGDGNTSTVRHPVHTYQTPGIKTVMLVATNIIGCSDTIFMNVSVYPLPEIHITAENVCLGNSTHFWDESILPAGTQVVYRLWSFGDPGSGAADSSHLENPEHLYAHSGEYQVRLFLRLNTGAENWKDTSVVVHGLPQASFDYQNSCYQDYTSFIDLSDTSEFPLTGWSWDFSDPTTGALNHSDAQNPMHLFSEEGGDYPVHLMVTDAFGCSDDTTIFVHIDSLPEAEFSVDTSCFKMNAVFTDLSVYHGSPITNWIWTFNDPSTGNADTSLQQNPSHAYSHPGAFYPQLIVESSKGCRDTISHVAFVRQIAHPLFTWDTVCYGTPTSFNDLSYTTNGAGIVSWFWDFGNGTSSLQNPAHTLPDWGFNPVQLSLIDENGCQNDTIIQVFVDSISLADFDIEQNCFGNMVHFINQSNPNGFTILDYFWDFGDSTYAYGYNTYHAYDRIDTFMVKLRIVNDNGCYDSIIKAVYVNPAIQADFYADTACVGFATHFYDTAFNQAVVIANRSWDFGDGNSGTGHNPTHIYDLPGVYNVQLTVTDTGNCTESVNRNISVHHAPSAAFTYNPSCYHDTVWFSDASSAINTDVTSWYWDFGDTASGTYNYSALQNPGHYFTLNQPYTVRLEVTDANGCIDSVEQEILFNIQPLADFSFDTVCAGSLSQFYDLSSTAEGLIEHWYWNFGDTASGSQNLSTLQNPAHIFSKIGVYDVQLIVENSAGCLDTLIREVFVKPVPKAAFTAVSDCSGEAISFVNTSQPYSPYHPIAHWLWEFGDGSTDTLFQMQHIYSAPGNYLVSLTAWDSVGCANTYDSVISIYALPEPDFTYSSPCSGQETNFTDLSNGLGANITQWFWDFDDPLSGAYNQSSLQNPGHIFVNTGNYDIKLGVLNANGCYQEIYKTIQIHEAPIADFEAETSCIGDSVYFQNFSFANNDSIVSWNWNFGDGSSSLEKNPVHIYTQNGIYGVSLSLTTLSGCTAIANKNLEIAPLPIAAFELQLPNCFGDSTRFLDQSVDPNGHPIDQWLWSFGDGEFSNEQNPAHLFSTAGQKQIDLMVTDTLGCSGSVTQNIFINESPSANFSYSVFHCDSVQFTDYSIANNDSIVSWYWGFGDPASGWNNHATSQNPVHVFADEGIYSITLIVTSGNACQDTIVQSLEIIKPISDFVYDSVCYGNPTYFMEMASSASGNIISYFWDFGDGSTSNIPNPSHIFPSAGYYGVSLTVTDYNGCVDIMQKYITIHYPPQADFSTNTPLCSYDSVSFTNLSHGFGTTPLIAYQWDFGDGINSSVENPVHFYIQPGSYFVSLMVEDSNHCVHDTTMTITVNQQPNAAFNVNTNNCDTLFFFDASTGQEEIIYWHWDFDDPTSGAFNVSTLQNPWHIFTQEGSYDVRLIATSSSGCSDTIVQNVYFEPLPSVNFTFDTVCFGDSTHFAGISNSPQINNWQWDFGDGDSGYGQYAAHQFSDPGTHQVVLQITNYLGCTNQIMRNIEVADRPEALFSSNDSVCNGSFVQFTDQSLAGNSPIIDWMWHFGDGDFSTEQNPEHLYNSSGTYEVWLRVANTAGCIDSVMAPIFVGEAPQSGFIFDTVCLGMPTSFIDTSHTAASWIVYRHWSFGDGSDTLNIQNPPHVYENPGTYTVELVVGDYNGCYDTSEHQVLVRELPQADFIASSDSLCLGDTIWFTDASTSTSGDLISWTWYFGEPSSGSSDTSHLQNPYHVYAHPGTYYVLLVVENANGCFDEIVQSVFIRNIPSANFNWDAGCAYEDVSFYDLSSSINSEISEWQWDFGDGTTSTEQNPVHDYNITTDSSFVVQLISKDLHGCSDSIVQEVFLQGMPSAAFTYEAEKPCSGGAFLFTDLSSTSGNLQSWLWLFGDNDSSHLQNPSHIFENSGQYNVQLIVTNSGGCNDTVSQSIQVFPLPVLDFDFDTVCFGDTTHFNSSTLSSSGINNWYWDFGDGHTADAADPTHIFGSGGVFSVSLMAGDSNLCEAVVSKDVFVRYLPEIDFVADTSCFGFPTHFSGISDDEILQWQWDFGDTLGFSFAQDTLYQYLQAGDYIVHLNAEDAYGCANSYSKHVQVYTPPVAYFNYSNTYCDDGMVFFSDSSYGVESQLRNWTWEFEEDYISFLQNPDYVFDKTDTSYDVRLIVHDVRGCVDTTIQSVHILPEFAVSFSSKVNCLGDTAWLYAHNHAIGDSVASWKWLIDGIPAITTTKDSVAIWLEDINPREVLLVATDISACVDSVYGLIALTDTPHIAFDHTVAACYDTTFFTDKTINTAGDIALWKWNFGDSLSGNPNISFDQNPGHLYSPQDSVYQVSLYVENSFGCAGSLQSTVLKYPCVGVNYNIVGRKCANDSLLFRENSFAGSSGIHIQQWEWRFDDGEPLIYQEHRDSIWHQFSLPGYYQVKLIVSAEMDGVSTKDSLITSVFINPLPQSSFSWSNSCQNDSTYFENLSMISQGSIANYLWEFGDGWTSSQLNPVHVFRNDSSYHTQLITVSDSGCQNMIAEIVEVFPQPNPKLAFSDTVGCGNPAFITLYDTSAQSFASYSWNFGDESFAQSTLPFTNHEFFPGSYSITLDVVSDKNCRNKVSKNLNVHKKPVALFDYHPSTVSILDSKVSFTDLSYGTDGVISQVFWDMNGVLDSINSHPYCVFSDTGDVLVSLKVIDNYGCSDTVMHTIRVNPELIFQIANAIIIRDGYTNATFGPISKYFDTRDYKFLIFNRWGEQVFESSEYENRWDGTFNGKPCPYGAYVWTLNVHDLEGIGRAYKGVVYLIK